MTAFKAEYRKLLRIRSRGVAQVRGYFAHEGRPILVLEHVDGPNLAQWRRSNPSQPDRADALAQLSQAVAELHDERLSHGDLLDGNVVVGANRGAVLIDPHAGLGAVASAPSPDLPALASLIRFLAPEHVEGQLASLCRALEGTVSGMTARVAAEQLLAFQQNPAILPSNVETLRAAGERAHARAEAVSKQYQENRLARKLSIDRLAAQIQEVAQWFPVRVEVIAPPDEAETAADTGGYGTFVHRGIEVIAPATGRARWSIHFHEVPRFARPWPYREDTVVAKGEWVVDDDGDKASLGRLELWVDPFGPRFMAFAQSPPSPYEDPEFADPVMVDHAWLLCRLAELTDSEIEPDS